jgi:hypothetical protein
LAAGVFVTVVLAIVRFCTILFDFAAADLAGVAESSRRDLKPEIGDFCLPAPARTRAMLD